MKYSKRAKGFTRIVCFLLAIFIGNMTITVAAKGNTVQEENQNQILISSTAGQHGVYEYDEETDSVRFIPPEEYMVGETSPEEYMTGETSPDDNVDQEQEMDEELFDILSSVAASTENGVYVPVLYPAGVEASTCLIGARFQSGGREHVSVGTGWLIDNTHVVTAGHCLYDPAYKNNGKEGYALHVAVYVGASDGTAKQYRLGHWKLVGGDYVKHSESEQEYNAYGIFDDWGVIKLDSPVTVNVSKLKLRVVNGYNAMKNKTYTTVGYPCDHEENKDIWEEWNKYRMFRMKGTFYQNLANPDSVSNAEPNYIGLVSSNDFKFQRGQSGSPMYITENGVTYGDGIVVANYYLNNSPVPCVLYINQWLYDHLTDLA